MAPFIFSRDDTLNAGVDPNTIKIIITKLCKQKSGFLAKQSADASTSTRGAMGFLLILAAIVMFGHCLAQTDPPKKPAAVASQPAASPPASPPAYTASATDAGATARSAPVAAREKKTPTKRSRAEAFAIGTFIVGFVALFMTMYVFTVNHQFYCEENPKWFRWDKEWLITAFVPGFFAAMSTANWTWLGVNLTLGHLKPEKFVSVPFGVWVIAVVIGPFALVAAVALGIVWMIIYTIYWLILSAAMCGFQKYDPLPDSKKASSGQQSASQPAAQNVGSGGK